MSSGSVSPLSALLPSVYDIGEEEGRPFIVSQ
jgi:hypothetical protein